MSNTSRPAKTLWQLNWETALEYPWRKVNRNQLLIFPLAVMYVFLILGISIPLGVAAAYHFMNQNLTPLLLGVWSFALWMPLKLLGTGYFLGQSASLMGQWERIGYQEPAQEPRPRMRFYFQQGGRLVLLAMVPVSVVVLLGLLGHMALREIMHDRLGFVQYSILAGNWGAAFVLHLLLSPIWLGMGYRFLKQYHPDFQPEPESAGEGTVPTQATVSSKPSLAWVGEGLRLGLARYGATWAILTMALMLWSFGFSMLSLTCVGMVFLPVWTLPFLWSTVHLLGQLYYEPEPVLNEDLPNA